MAALDDAFPALDGRFERFRDEASVPGVAWSVVAGGTMIHAGGAGTIRDGEDRRPGPDSVFRIASMTKSFTAATLLLLRDEGRLRLDDPVADHVPSLAAWRPPARDTPPVTIRQLLTMGAGLPTDDPWGDRQQALPFDAFARLLEAGPTFAWPPDTVFDYSNLGYGILGRVVTSAADAEYADVVRDRLLRPLGLSSTAYDPADVPEPDLASGYVRRGDELVREGTDGYGAMASMGGLWSSARDLARWVVELLDAFPARDDPEDGHPLRRATRREMQQVQRAIPPERAKGAAHAPSVVVQGGYGFGLFVQHDLELGTLVSHSGGYPGFGSYMGWHPASGLGVAALGNLRYAPLRGIGDERLRILVREEAAPRRRPTPLPAVERCRRAAEALLAAWDEGLADDEFAMNMDLDEPRERRRASVERIAAELGPFAPDPSRPVRSDSPADLTWWLRGARGWARVSILVSPEPEPRLQRLEVTAVPDPPATLAALAERVLRLAEDDAPAVSADLDLSPTVDPATVGRMLRAAGARFGALRLGPPVAGDGERTASFELEGADGTALLEVGIDPATGAVSALWLGEDERAAPAEGW